MSEKPILFSGQMVQAILAGKKTQTRRIIRFPHSETDGDAPERVNLRNDGKYCFYLPGAEAALWKIKPPFQAGDALWVRETWGIGIQHTGGVIYRADYGDPCKAIPFAEGEKWKPSIFMPRAVARIFLSVKAVRAERLQDISGRDVVCEGLPSYIDKNYAEYNENWLGFVWYKELWDSLNASRGFGWNANHAAWVWVYEFERLEVTPKPAERKSGSEV
jgi:hypothetical protein